VNAAKLNDAITLGWTKSLPHPYGDGSFSSAVDGMTDCNRFVNLVCQAMGYTKFVREGQVMPILANDMFDEMSKPEGDWKELDGAKAQWYANTGALVIAAWKNPTGSHGHVCVVRIGELGDSHNWKSEAVPKVANVSRPDLCRIDRGANYAFSEEPKYFGLKATM
jgi:hypothetical protein